MGKKNRKREDHMAWYWAQHFSPTEQAGFLSIRIWIDYVRVRIAWEAIAYTTHDDGSEDTFIQMV